MAGIEPKLSNHSASLIVASAFGSKLRLTDHRLDLLAVYDQAVQLGDPGDRRRGRRILLRRHRATVDFEVHLGDGGDRNLGRESVLTLQFLDTGGDLRISHKR